MMVRIFDHEPFGGGGVVEGLIRRNQRYRPEPGCLLEPVDIKNDRQLDGVISPEPTLAGCEHRLVEKDRGELDNAI